MSVAELWDEIYQGVNSIEVTTLSSLYKLFISLVLGCLVGYERKRRGQPVGVRTFALIAMGSTLAMILSIYVPQEYLGLKNGDPGRIAAQVVTGIGFLGAGAIIQMKGSVRGLTTAAGIWMVAAIGMAVGVGMYVIATIATVLILFILVLLDRFEHRANLGADIRSVKLVTDKIIASIDDYRKVLSAHKIRVTRYNLKCDYVHNTTEVEMVILVPEGVDFMGLLPELRQLNPTISISMTCNS